MGKIERLKLERKLLEQKKKEIKSQSAYRNRIFVYGFAAGAILFTVIGFSIGKSQAQVSQVSGVPNISTNSAILASPLSLPDNVNLRGATPLPLQLQQ